MGTAACVRFYPTDEEQKGWDGGAGVVTIYKACDGYPQGVIPFLIAARRFTLPKYESDEFAAGFVAAILTQDGRGSGFRGGEVRIVPFEGEDAYVRYAPYTDYLYDIRWVAGEVRVIFDDGDGDHEIVIGEMPSAVIMA